MDGVHLVYRLNHISRKHVEKMVLDPVCKQEKTYKPNGKTELSKGMIMIFDRMNYF